MHLHRKSRFVEDASFSVHLKVTNFLVEMTNFHSILTDECGDAPICTVCIQRSLLFKDHLVVSQLWLYNALLPLLRDYLYSKTTFFDP